jgi:serine/threonine protein kinase
MGSTCSISKTHNHEIIQKRNKRYWSNNYIILGVLGKYEFGDIYKFSTISENCAFKSPIYSIKFLQHSDNDDNINDHFVNEFKILKLCNHGLIQSINKTTISHDLTGFISNYEEHIMLEQILGNIPSKYIKNIFYEIVIALTYLHLQNIIHRDLIASNVLLTSSGHIKIINFECAITYNPDVSFDKYSIRGNIECRAYEIFFNDFRKYTPNVDWWSAGILLYMMLLGQHPYIDYDLNGLTHVDKERLLTESTRFDILSNKIKHIKYGIIDIKYQHIIQELLHIIPEKRTCTNILKNSIFSEINDNYCVYNSCFDYMDVVQYAKINKLVYDYTNPITLTDFVKKCN